MLQRRSQHVEGAVNVLGSPAQHTRERGHDAHSALDVLAAAYGSERRGEVQSPQAQASYLISSGDKTAGLANADPAAASSAVSRALNDTDVAGSLVGTRDLQRGLLEQKLHNMQREINATREELKETTARLTQVTVKLNEQRVESSALTHRYSAAVEKLTAAENGIKRLEEQLVQERRQHALVRNERDKVKLSLQELNWEVEKLRRELQEERDKPAIDPREVQRMLEDRDKYVPAAEVQRRCDEMRNTGQTLVTRFAVVLDKLLLQREEEETSVFVARSAVLSAATDLEAKVASAEATLAALYDQLLLFNEGSEREMAEMITSLMQENKELWQHLSKLKTDNDALVAQLAMPCRKSGCVSHEQYEYIEKQLSLATEKLLDAQKTVEAQVSIEKEHEEQMRILINTNESLENQVRSFTEQLRETKNEVERKERELVEAKMETKEALRQSDELQSNVSAERRRMNDTVKELNEKLLSREAACDHQLRQLQEERDAACRDAERRRHELEDTQQKIITLQEELESCTQHFESYKQRSEEQQRQMGYSLQEEAAAARELLESELAFARNELESQRAVIREMGRERDNEQTERRAAQAIAAGLDAEVTQQRNENDKQQRRLAEVTEQLRELEAEADQLRQRCESSSDETCHLQREVSQLRERVVEIEQLLQQERAARVHESTQHLKEVRELERSRDMLREETKKLFLRVEEANMERQQCLPRERIEAERESLMRENVRLHEQYQEVQQENVALRETVQQLRAKVLNNEQLVQQLDDVQGRLRQLPALRQAAEDARRDAMRAAEETESLRQERDAMAAKLDFFIEESKRAAKKDEEWGRIIRDAAEQTRRLGSQMVLTREQAQRRGALGFTAHPGGYSEQQSNYQRVLFSAQQKQSPPSPQPAAPVMPRPWR